MKRDIKKCLFDIKTSIQSIVVYTEGQQDIDSYRKNKLVRRAVERELEIIGEAVSRILKIDPSFQIHNARRIIDTRNWVIHGYDNVDDMVIWGVISIHLPRLEQEVNSYLEEE